jgi:hypothetical protein
MDVLIKTSELCGASHCIRASEIKKLNKFMVNASCLRLQKDVHWIYERSAIHLG